MSGRTTVVPTAESAASSLARRAMAHVRLLIAVFGGEDEIIDFSENEIIQEEPNWPHGQP